MRAVAASTSQIADVDYRMAIAGSPLYIVHGVFLCSHGPGAGGVRGKSASPAAYDNTVGAVCFFVTHKKEEALERAT